MITTLETANPLTNAAIAAVGVDAADYIKQAHKRGTQGFVMSRSELCEFNACPSRWLDGMKTSSTDATEWGSLMDCRLLEPQKFGERYVVAPATYPFTPKKKGAATVDKPWNRNATFCKEWEEDYHPKTVITSDDMAESGYALKRLLARRSIRELVQNSQKQVLVESEYRDEATGIVVPVKCLIDLVPDLHSEFGKSLADFKTSRSAEPRTWAKYVFERDYHVQAAMHLDAYVAATDEDRVEFRHIIQENFPPYQPARRIISQEYLELGRAIYKAALKRYCQCLAADEWPDYDDGARETINGWQITQPEAWMVR